jgi:hypothetical protein
MKTKPPKHVACHHCGTLVRAQWTKKHDLPPGISLMGFSTCPKCNRPALHIKGDPDAVAEVAVMYEDHMGAKEPPDARLTDMATGKPRLDG